MIGIGAVGSAAAGVLADRWGRTTVTMAAMAVSGTCALIIGPLFGEPPWLLLAVALVWGISVIADSAQFSAAIAELRRVGEDLVEDDQVKRPEAMQKERE